eukprot:6182891-Pleurochrysis_carterae.AAC.2
MSSTRAISPGQVHPSFHSSQKLPKRNASKHASMLQHSLNANVACGQNVQPLDPDGGRHEAFARTSAHCVVGGVQECKAVYAQQWKLRCGRSNLNCLGCSYKLRSRLPSSQERRGHRLFLRLYAAIGTLSGGFEARGSLRAWPTTYIFQIPRRAIAASRSLKISLRVAVAAAAAASVKLSSAATTLTAVHSGKRDFSTVAALQPARRAASVVVPFAVSARYRSYILNADLNVANLNATATASTQKTVGYRGALGLHGTHATQGHPTRRDATATTRTAAEAQLLVIPEAHAAGTAAKMEAARKKRGAGNELTQLNYEQEADENESTDPGTWQPASEVCAPAPLLFVQLYALSCRATLRNTSGLLASS